MAASRARPCWPPAASCPTAGKLSSTWRRGEGRTASCREFFQDMRRRGLPDPLLEVRCWRLNAGRENSFLCRSSTLRRRAGTAAPHYAFWRPLTFLALPLEHHSSGVD
jgi:hypothetical protein